eukprot:3490247-Amphidinium_carterae.1
MAAPETKLSLFSFFAPPALLQTFALCISLQVVVLLASSRIWQRSAPRHVKNSQRKDQTQWHSDPSKVPRANNSDGNRYNCNPKQMNVAIVLAMFT